MEIQSLDPRHRHPLLVATSLTVLSLLAAVFLFRFRSRSRMPRRELDPGEMAVGERQTGASMMEQLVPEITTHALSYLDYPSLCRLSMTNSDFTVEQGSVTPVNGWKAYYAATRAVVNVNRQFFSIIRERSLPAMSSLWLNADYVKCIHATGERFSGYNAVIQSWQMALNWDHGADFQLRDVRARVLTDMAWVTMIAYYDVDSGPFHITNVFEFHNGQWRMVHHHSSVDEEAVDQHIVHG